MKFARFCSLALVGWFSVVAAAQAGKQDGRLDVYWIDVEGGAATLIVTPAGESVLIDSGNPGRRDPDRIVQVAGKVAGLRQIDNLATTHYHRDHFGGASAIAAVMPIRKVFDNGEFPGGRERPDPDYLQFKADERVVLNPGDLVPLAVSTAKGAPRLSLKCVGARQEFIPPPPGAKKNDEPNSKYKPKDRDDSDNANSLVLLLQFGDFELFDAGDLTWNVEYKMVHPYELVGQVDVYQSTHHGLDQSNNSLLVEALAPRVAIVNNGHTKGCEPGTFATLKETKSIEAIYQVHRNLRPDGAENNTADEYIANNEPAESCQGNYIRLSVAADGKSYTVDIPANKHSRTYRCK